MTECEKQHTKKWKKRYNDEHIKENISRRIINEEDNKLTVEQI